MQTRVCVACSCMSGGRRARVLHTAACTYCSWSVQAVDTKKRRVCDSCTITLQLLV